MFRESRDVHMIGCAAQFVAVRIFIVVALRIPLPRIGAFELQTIRPKST